jgi:hypothetical protein
MHWCGSSCDAGVVIQDVVLPFIRYKLRSKLRKSLVVRCCPSMWYAHVLWRLHSTFCCVCHCKQSEELSFFDRNLSEVPPVGYWLTTASGCRVSKQSESIQDECTSNHLWGSVHKDRVHVLVLIIRHICNCCLTLILTYYLGHSQSQGTLTALGYSTA